LTTIGIVSSRAPAGARYVYLTSRATGVTHDRRQTHARAHRAPAIRGSRLRELLAEPVDQAATDIVI
jgi:hypothetical protein